MQKEVGVVVVSMENIGDVFPLTCVLHTHAEIRDTIVLNRKNTKYTTTERLRCFSRKASQVCFR